MGLSNDLSCEAGSLSCCPGLRSLLHSPPFVRFICANVGLQGLLVVRLPAPFVPHSASLSPTTATRVLSTPVPVSAPPTGLDECLFSISLVLVPLPFNSLSVLVVRGGSVCLPTPPSWFSSSFLFLSLFHSFCLYVGYNAIRTPMLPH